VCFSTFLLFRGEKKDDRDICVVVPGIYIEAEEKPSLGVSG
jgi:hypothetical protein